MSIIYDLIFLIIALIYLPVYLVRGKFNRGFLRRFGFMTQKLDLDRPIWIHAVSVGEVIAIKGLVSRLRQLYPQKKIVISTVTSTGNKIAQNLIAPGDYLTYLPLDFSFIVRRVLKKINPSMFIIAETEIWPNLISCLAKMRVPVVVVNGRISDSSYRGYLLVRFFIRPVLRRVKQFCVQTDLDLRRLEDLGVESSRIQVTGNVKFDQSLDYSQPDALVYREALWLAQTDKLLVCGSTHPHEEEIIFSAYRQLLEAFPNLKLLIAPRHPERSKQVAGLAVKFSFKPVFISGVSVACPTCISRPVFILDTIGELYKYYSASDIVFVGGSLVKKGGHNILEPASLKKPVLFGPYMFNFRDISGLFLANQAAIVVEDSQKLFEQVRRLLNSNLLVKKQVELAYDLIIKNRGATEKNIQIISQLG
jgi:3-deoxy-D-manno-octulosonic-acid transferase